LTIQGRETKISESTSDNYQFKERASYVIGLGFPIVQPLHAEAGFNKVLCENSHIAAPRLNGAQRIPPETTDSWAKGYNRKKHIKREKVLENTEISKSISLNEQIERRGGCEGVLVCKNFLWMARRFGRSFLCFPFYWTK
jgi:hypothetical protein